MSAHAAGVVGLAWQRTCLLAAAATVAAGVHGRECLKVLCLTCLRGCRGS